jgi:hypothetical protein
MRLVKSLREKLLQSSLSFCEELRLVQAVIRRFAMVEVVRQLGAVLTLVSDGRAPKAGVGKQTGPIKACRLAFWWQWTGGLVDLVRVTRAWRVPPVLVHTVAAPLRTTTISAQRERFSTVGSPSRHCKMFQARHPK